MSEHHDDGGTPPGPPDFGDAKSGDGRSEEQRTATAPGEQPLGAEVSREELEKKVERLSAMLEDSISRARETQERLKDTHERLLRVAAEFENFKRLAQRDQREYYRFANESLLKELLPIVDNLERAIKSSKERMGSGGLIQGVELVLKQFLETLAKFGVRPMNSVGEAFDPSRHQAVLHVESEDATGKIVAEEYQRGYLLHDRILRAAMVAVADVPKRDACEGAKVSPSTDGDPVDTD